MLVLPPTHLVIGDQVNTTTHVLGQTGLQADRLAQHVVALLQVEIARPAPVHDDLLEGLTGQDSVRNEGAGQRVALVP
ncbi:hypothetical protein D3C80_2087400 [compost metagenome]